jgi:broad-specificity NMP kinase
VRRILITGISGTGKSTVVAQLAARGERAVDLDSDEYSEWVDVDDDEGTPGEPVEPGRDWIWREQRVDALLSDEAGEVLVVSGTAANMRQFMPRFDHVILLSAPPEVLAERLRTRTTNSYGRAPEHLARVLDTKRTVEPLLRRAADQEIDTTQALEAVVDAVSAAARASA